MPSPFKVTIEDGVGYLPVLNGSYDVSAAFTGYDNNSISPSSQVVTAETLTYSFTVAAEGTLTLHVSEEGTAGGTAVVGAEFARCDAGGTVYGSTVFSDTDGNAVFEHVPFADTGSPIIYFKQIASDGDHEFDISLANTTLTLSTKTMEIRNAEAATRQFNLVDANYADLPIAEGELTLTKR